MAKRKHGRKQITVDATRFQRMVPSEKLHKERNSWDSAMKLGVTGLVTAFVVRVLYDTYVAMEGPNYNYALYHGIIFGAVVMLVWRFWPWRR